jgi:hypothetical protein
MGHGLGEFIALLIVHADIIQESTLLYPVIDPYRDIQPSFAAFQKELELSHFKIRQGFLPQTFQLKIRDSDLSPQKGRVLESFERAMTQSRGPVILSPIVESDELKALHAEFLGSAVPDLPESYLGLAEMTGGFGDVPQVPLENAHADKAFPLLVRQPIPARYGESFLESNEGLFEFALGPKQGSLDERTLE